MSRGKYLAREGPGSRLTEHTTQGAAQGCLQGVKPDNFEADAIFKFFDYYSRPSFKLFVRLLF